MLEMKKQYPISICLLSMCIFSFTKNTAAQESFIQASFQKDTMVIENIKHIQKNIFSITSAKKQHLKIVFATVDGDKINIAFTKVIDTTIQANITSYFSVHYTLLDRSDKEWSSIQAYVYSSDDLLLQQHNFVVHLSKISKWSAYQNSTPYFLMHSIDTQKVLIHLYNEGNVNERIKATVIPATHLKKEVSGWADSIILAPKKNMQWALSIPIKYLIKKKEKKAVPIILISSSSGKVIKLPITILIPGSTYSKALNTNSEDVYIQTETGQVWRNNTTQTRLGINGKIRIDSSAFIDFRYRDFSFMQYAKLPTSFASITYHSKTAFLYVGNLIETNDFFVDGLGLRFKRNLSSSDFGFTLAKDRVRDAYFTNWQWKHQLLYKNLFATAQITTYANIGSGTQSAIPQIQVQWRDSNKTSIKFFIGTSRERLQKIKFDTILLSNMQGYAFHTKWKLLNIQSSLLHYGKNYAGGNRGLDQHNHSILFQQRPFSVKVFYTSNDKSFLYANDSAMYLLQGVASREVGLSVSWAQRQIFHQIQPSVFTQYVDDVAGIRSNIYKLMYNGRWNWGKNSFTLLGNIGVNKITQNYTHYAYVHNIRAEIINADVRLALEWNKGPYFYYDVKRYIEDNSHTNNNLYLTLQKTWNFASINLSMQSYATFQSINPSVGNNLGLSHYIQYSPMNWNADIGLLMQWNTTAAASNFIELTFRKRWTKDIQSLFRSKKRITLYQDKNGNGHLDNNENLLANKPIWVNEQLLMTNAKGQIAIKHSDVPTYNISLNDIETSTEWAPTNGYEQQVVVDKNVDIAFQANGIIRGRLEVLKAKFTVGSIQLDGIKIYIRNEFNRFTTVTDVNGNFEMPFPKGAYTISVDENTLSDNLVTTIIPQPVNVASQASAYVSITLQQKERAIKIKQQ